MPTARSIIYLGLDVHKESMTIAVLPAGTKGPTHLDRLPNDLPKLKRRLDRAVSQGELRACYEASGAGYVIQLCDPARAARVGLRVRRDRAVAHSETAGRAAEAR
jgi:hypothetical protein